MTVIGWIPDASALAAIVGAAVSIYSAVIAWRAKEQARKAATLEPRNKAVTHLRNALYDTTKHARVTGKTLNSIQQTMHLAATVFSQPIRDGLDAAYAKAMHLHKRLDIELTDQEEQDTLALSESLQALISQMNKEAALA
jgi:K+-sensing histidine kinase KdpD